MRKDITFAMLISFKNKIVWITGASSGIGEALACAFAREGSKLVLSARREEELQRVKNKCRLNDDDCLILPLDLSDTENISSLIETVVNKFGRIDVLVNNGGVSQRAFAKDAPLDIDRKIMEVNYFGTVAITKNILPVMLRQKQGDIVVISSVSGKFGFYLRSAYSASKHALHGFFESLRMEVHKENIRVLLVCPGRIRTEISVSAINEKGQKNGTMDKYDSNSISAEECAEKILTALKKRKEEIYVGGPRERMALRLKRFFPNLFSKIIRKQKAE
jgi:short-subunit dehydrogenase